MSVVQAVAGSTGNALMQHHAKLTYMIRPKFSSSSQQWPALFSGSSQGICLRTSSP